MSGKTTIRDATLHLSEDGNTVRIDVEEGNGTVAFSMRVVRGQKPKLRNFFETHED